MTTTELIQLLKENEKGGVTNKSRYICISFQGMYLSEPDIEVISSSDGLITNIHLSVEKVNLSFKEKLSLIFNIIKVKGK